MRAWCITQDTEQMDGVAPKTKVSRMDTYMCMCMWLKLITVEGRLDSISRVTYDQ